MDAIKLLKQQHRLVENLFSGFEDTDDDDEKEQLFFEIADNLAVHASIEERFFYPAVREKRTEERVDESYEEHLEMKKLLLDAMHSTDEPGFDGKVAALKGAVIHHVQEEEDELFPEVTQILERDALEAIGQQMEAATEEMMAAGEPRNEVRVESEPPVIQP
ncbi:MAG: hemerythrin domain-containing protein [Polyangia bacterium]|jgi:hypothetical protein